MQKTCSKCHKKFQIIQQEQLFLKKMELPLPAQCPTCRQDRRMSLRNDQQFHKYPCSKCKKDMVTTVDPEKKITVYCLNCYADFRANVDLTKSEMT